MGCAPSSSKIQPIRSPGSSNPELLVPTTQPEPQAPRPPADETTASSSTSSPAAASVNKSPRSSNSNHAAQRPAPTSRNGETIEDVNALYELLSPLGNGASCTVYKARLREDGQEYALKKISKIDAINKSLYEQEIQVLRRLNHKNVLRMMSHFEDHASYYIATRMCTGGELFDHVASMEGNAFSEKVASSYARQLLTGLAYCHDLKITHRDLKPENFVFTDESKESELQIIDFGCALSVEDEAIVKDVCGSPYYIAPEVLDKQMQAQRTGAVWRASDMWSIGVCVYLLVTGRPPFYAESTQGIFAKIKEGRYKLPKSLSPACSSFLKALLIKDPLHRLTAKQALAHEFIRKENNRASNLPMPASVVTALGDFNRVNKLKRAVGKALDRKLSEKDRQALKEIFLKFDTDGDGKLSAEELARMIERTGHGKPDRTVSIMHEMDEDGDQAISFEEFSAGVAAQNVGADVAWELLFRVGRGDIVSLIQMEEQLVHLTREELVHLIAEVDTNNDGRISFDEWVAAMGAGNVSRRLTLKASLTGNSLKQFGTGSSAGTAGSSLTSVSE